MGRKLSVLLAGFVFVTSTAAFAAEQAKYVFLFIGDGMGPVQRQSANLVSKALTGKEMLMETLPARGQIHTKAANSDVTDSAAAATALASGFKTNNGMIGQLPDGTDVQSVTTTLQREGYNTGIITSVGLNHATPAGFFAHADGRNMYNEIAKQIPSTGVDLIIGNGLLSESEKQDEIIAGWKKAGVHVTTSLDGSAPKDKQVVAILEYPGASTEKKQDGAGKLAESVAFAIEYLGTAEPFFIMTEGGKVDGEGHGNRAGEAIDETHALDRAVQVAHRFYEQHPEETLIVVTADHETGGMGIVEGKFDPKRIVALIGKGSDMAKAVKGTDVTTESAAAAVADVLGVTDLSDEEKSQLAKAVDEQKKEDKGQVARAAMLVAQARAGITWQHGGHTGVDVPLTAIGVGADEFKGTFDNTEVPKKILELVLEPAAVK